MVENVRDILHRAGWKRGAVLEESYFSAKQGPRPRSQLIGGKNTPSFNSLQA